MLRSPSLEVWRNLDFEGVGHRSGALHPVTEISPVAYRVPRGRSGTVWIDAPYQRGWTLDGTPGEPTSEGALRFTLRSDAGGVATFSPWGAVQDGYLASGAAAALAAVVVVMDRRHRRTLH